MVQLAWFAGGCLPTSPVGATGMWRCRPLSSLEGGLWQETRFVFRLL